MKIRILTLLPLTLLGACGGGATFEQVTQARIGRISDMGTQIGRDATHLNPETVCPPGMVLVDADARYDSETDSRYRERHGDSRSYRGYRNGAGISTPSNANGRLQIETRQEARGRWTCERLVPESQQRR